MTQPQILSGLQDVFDGIFLEPVKVTAELTAKQVQEWDSLTHVSLVLAIESAFKVRFRVGEVEATRNVGELAALIARHLAA